MWHLPPSWSFSPFTLNEKCVLPSWLIFSLSPLISLRHPCFIFPHPLLSVFAPSSACYSVRCSKGLRVGYSEGCYGVWPQFSTVTYLLSSFPLLSEWLCLYLRVCVSVCFFYNVWPPPSVWMKVFGDTPTPAENVSLLDILSDPIPEKHYKESEVCTALL